MNATPVPVRFAVHRTMDIVMRFAVKDAVDDAVVRIVHGPVASAVYFAVDDAALRAMREELYS